MNCDLALQLNLIFPPSVEGHELLLRVETVVENAQDVLLSADQLQTLDPRGA